MIIRKILGLGIMAVAILLILVIIAAVIDITLTEEDWELEPLIVVSILIGVVSIPTFFLGRRIFIDKKIVFWHYVNIGTALMFFSILFTALFLVGYLGVLEDQKIKTDTSAFGFLYTSVGALVLMGFLFFYGKKLYNRARIVSQPETINIKVALDMQIEVEIGLKEYMRFTFVEHYSRGISIWMTLIGLLMLLVVIDHLFIGSLATDSFPILQLLFGVAFLFVIPTSIYLSAKKNFETNKRLSEPITYRFNSEEIELSGLTFISKLKWSNIVSVKERKGWFLLGVDKTQGYYIPKDRFASKSQELEFKEFVRGLKRVEKQLKA